MTGSSCACSYFQQRGLARVLVVGRANQSASSNHKKPGMRMDIPYFFDFIVTQTMYSTRDLME